jgi:hypothetical protein
MCSMSRNSRGTNYTVYMYYSPALTGEMCSLFVDIELWMCSPVNQSPECGYYCDDILRAGSVAGLGGFRYTDLDTPMLLADDPFTGGYEQRGGIYDVSGVKSGLGIERK